MYVCERGKVIYIHDVSVSVREGDTDTRRLLGGDVLTQGAAWRAGRRGRERHCGEVEAQHTLRRCVGRNSSLQNLVLPSSQSRSVAYTYSSVNYS